MKFKLKPYKHQLEAIAASAPLTNYALFFEAGTGKTGTLINMLRVKYMERGAVNTLIIAPLVTLNNWKNEFNLHSYIKHDQITVANKTGKARIKQIVENEGHILIINYEAVMNETIYKHLIKEWKPKIIACDESHIIKNPKSKRAKRVIALGDQAENRYCLTGTPILNSPMDIFNQYRFLDKGTTFGLNFFVFRSKYFIDENAQWANKPGHFPKFVPIKSMFPILNEQIYKSAMRVLKDECLDLPDLIKEKQIIDMSKDQARYYKQMKNEFITFVASKTEEGVPQASIAQLAITKALRLMQIASGFIKVESGEEIQIGNPKLEALKLLVEEITPDHKLIVWCSFKNNYTTISRLLKEMKIDFEMLTGEMNSKQKEEAMNEFRTNPKCRVIIANRKAGGIGINLVEAAYSVVFSRNFSLEEEIQSEARNYRSGSESHEKIVKIDLVMKDTIEEAVLVALQNKESLAGSIIDMIKEEK